METKVKKISDRKQAFIEKRKELIELSNVVRPLVKEGEYNNINEALIDQYTENNPLIKEFNTFKQWKERGFMILKGAKAFLVWGQPRQTQQTPNGEEEPEEFKYWPVCFLFANTQVIKPEQEKSENKKEPQKQEEAIPL